MRFLCSCSAALVLLAGCGSKTAHAPDPFAYDQSRPLAVHDAGVALSGPKVAVHVVTFAGARRVNAFLVVPRSPAATRPSSSCTGAGATARICCCRRSSWRRAAPSR